MPGRRSRRARRQVRSMTVTTARTSPTPTPVRRPGARLTLTPPGRTTGLLDGAWWPRSRDLMQELPALAEILDARWGRITRVTVNPRHWPVVPRRVPVAGHVVRAGWFVEQDPHKLLLLSGRTGRWDLLVIPPETEPGAAQRLMRKAADPRCRATASALVLDEQVRSGGAFATLLEAAVLDLAPLDGAVRGAEPAERAWESEGGALPPLGRPCRGAAAPEPDL